jgi:hypothetical protein
MKIIRVLYGSYEGMWDDIPIKRYFKDETVFVWGTLNYDRLKKLGYHCILVNTLETDVQFSTWETHFAHKLRALELADKLYNEYLFLDWDVYPIKPLDDNFYTLIRSGGDIQVPLYCYHDDFFIDTHKMLEGKPFYDTALKNFLKKQESELKKYNYPLTISKEFFDLNNNKPLMVSPNFSFFYSRNKKIGKELMSLYLKYEIRCCVEEFSFFMFVNESSINDYIRKYEPYVLFGKSSDRLLPHTKYIVALNTFIRQQNIPKDVYLVHDVNYEKYYTKYEN